MAFGTFDRDVEKININVMLRFVIQTSNGFMRRRSTSFFQFGCREDLKCGKRVGLKSDGVSE